MKKLVLSAAAIVVAGALIGPKIISSQFAESIESTVASINNIPGYQASLTSIDSGWFSTQAVVNVGIQMPDMEELQQTPLDFSIDFAVNGSHGPVITSGGFSLALLRAQINSISADLPEGLSVEENAPIYNIVTQTGLFGGTSYKDKISAVEYVDAESQTTISFAGMEGQGELGSNSIVGSSKAGVLSVKMADVLSFEMSNIDISIDADASWTQIMQQELYSSVSNISIDDIQVMNAVEGTQTSIQNISMDGVTTLSEDSDLGSFEIVTKVANVDASDLNLSELLVTMQMNNLEGKFFKAYQDYSNELMDKMDNPQAIMEVTNTFFETHLLSQLQAEPEFNITTLSGKINGSNVDGKALTKLVGVSALPETMEDPSFWMQHAQVDSKINMQTAAANYIATQVIASQMAANPQFAQMTPEEQAGILAQQVAPTLDALVQQGMLVATDDGYEMVFTMQNSQALLNGVAIPL